MVQICGRKELRISDSFGGEQVLGRWREGSLRPRSKWLMRGPEWIGKAVLAAAVVSVPAGTLRAADGQLDTDFVPDPAYSEEAMPLGVVERAFYFGVMGGPVRRLVEDGSLDAAWEFSLAAPVTVITELVECPSGDWLVSDLSRTYWVGKSGEVEWQISRSGSAGGPTVFPQADGSVVQGGRLLRFDRTGERDPRFGRDLAFEAASFSDGTGTAVSGGPYTQVLEDSAGRFIVAGNLRSMAGLEHLGLARVLDDGIADPRWNPGSVLGIALDGEDRLNALPLALAAGPGGRVAVALLLVSTNGEPNLSFAELDEDGQLIRTFANPGFGREVRMVYQPDGRLLIGGNRRGASGAELPAVVRIGADGGVDPTFSVGISSVSGAVTITTMTLDELGRLWVAGWFDRVNGEPRAGLARILAYEPAAVAPGLALRHHQIRVATGELLILTAEVTGVPQLSLQWYRDGVAVPGQTHRSLRVAVEGVDQAGGYVLVASNASGVRELAFPAVEVVERSRAPGGLDETFERSLTEFSGVTHLLAMPDGAVLVGGGDVYDQNPNRESMVGRLRSDGILDPEFGESGVVLGDGYVEGLRVLLDGTILVAGKFTELGGVAAFGLAELNARGEVVERGWPVLDPAHASCVLRLEDGRYVVSGLFSSVDGAPANRLGRLKADLTLDDTFASALAPWQFVDDLELDLEGRVLVAGDRVYPLEIMTNAPPTGLQRLLESGEVDPEFQGYTGGVRRVVVEPDGTLLVFSSWNLGDGFPRRMTPDGALVMELEDFSRVATSHGRPGLPDHRAIRLSDGSVVGFDASSWRTAELVRWRADGSFDYDFEAVIGVDPADTQIQAIAAMADGTILVAGMGPGTGRPLLRVLPDSDRGFSRVAMMGGQLRATVATQPGRYYRIRRSENLDGSEPVIITSLVGDGYWQEVSVPIEGEAGWMDFVRE